jgi:hypothetical protein
MEMSKLGRTDLSVSRVCLGTMLGKLISFLLNILYLDGIGY